MRIRSYYKVIGVSLLGFLFSLLSCNETDQSEVNNIGFDTTKIFNEYINQNFNQTIPKERHLYVIISSKGCGLCINSVVQNIETIINKDTFTNVTFINANKKYHLQSSKNKILVDTTEGLNEYVFIQFITFIYTNLNKVDSISIINSSEKFVKRFNLTMFQK